MAGGWGCPHETDDQCGKVNNLPCNPGMKGCVLAGRFVFADETKNQRLRDKQTRDKLPDESLGNSDDSSLHP